MLGTILIGALSVATVLASVLAVFWKKIIQWVSKVVDVIKQKLNRVVEGSELFLKKVAGIFKQVSYNYSKTDNNQWIKDTIINKEEVDESQIPEDIREAAVALEENQTMDITDKTEEQVLSLLNT